MLVYSTAFGRTEKKVKLTHQILNDQLLNNRSIVNIPNLSTSKELKRQTKISGCRTQLLLCLLCRPSPHFP